MAGQCHRTRARARSKSIYGLAGKLWHFYGVAAKNLLGSKGTCHIKADNLHDSGFRGKWNSGYEWRTYRPFFLEQSHFYYADTQLMIVLEITKNDKGKEGNGCTMRNVPEQELLDEGQDVKKIIVTKTGLIVG